MVFPCASNLRNHWATALPEIQAQSAEKVNLEIGFNSDELM